MARASAGDRRGAHPPPRSPPFAWPAGPERLQRRPGRVGGREGSEAAKRVPGHRPPRPALPPRTGNSTAASSNLIALIQAARAGAGNRRAFECAGRRAAALSAHGYGHHRARRPPPRRPGPPRAGQRARAAAPGGVAGAHQGAGRRRRLAASDARVGAAGAGQRLVRGTRAVRRRVWLSAPLSTSPDSAPRARRPRRAHRAARRHGLADRPRRLPRRPALPRTRARPRRRGRRGGGGGMVARARGRPRRS